jgi:PKD repeat protein
VSVVPAVVLVVASMLVFAAPPAEAVVATPLPYCSTYTPFTVGDTLTTECAPNLRSTPSGEYVPLLRYDITANGVFTPDSDVPIPVTITIIPLNLPVPIGNYNPGWTDCFGDGCPAQQQGFPQRGFIRTPDEFGNLTGPFRRTGQFGWRLSQVPGQSLGCYRQLSCNYELRFLEGYSDDDGTWVATLDAPQQVLLDMTTGFAPLAFNERQPATAPVARFTATDQGKRTFRFDASTSTDTIVEYRWKFGDGEELVTADPVVDHVYRSPGPKTVSLQVVDAANNPSAEMSKVIEVPGILVNAIGDGARAPDRPGCDTGQQLDNGDAECTLRAAIEALNAGEGDTVEFDLPDGAGPIEPANPLPKVTADDATIDAATQDADPVVLRGHGLAFEGAERATLRGLTLLGGGTAIDLSNSPDATVESTRIGVAPDGSVDLPTSAIVIFDSPRTRLGGSAEAANVVAASDTGILVASSAGANSNDVRIEHNLIGVDRDGRRLAGDGTGVFGFGVTSSTAKRLQVLDNTIAGWDLNVAFTGQNVEGARLEGNRVGTDPSGTTTVGQATMNVRVDAAPAVVIRSNVIAGARNDLQVAGSLQIRVQQVDGKTTFEYVQPGGSLLSRPPTATGVVIDRNRVGLLAPTTSAPSTGVAIFADASDTTVTGNIVGGHARAEIRAHGTTRTTITGNDVGAASVGLAEVAIEVRGTTDSTVRRNTVGTARRGIAIADSATGLVVRDNVIGLDDSGGPRPVELGVAVGPGAGEVTIGPANTIANASIAAVQADRRSVVTGNLLGNASTGPNAVGLDLNADSTVSRNTITNSTAAGVDVATGAVVTLRSNAIYGTASKVGIQGAPAAPDVAGAARVQRGTSLRTWLVLTGLPTTGAGTIEVFGNTGCDDPEGRVPLFLVAPVPGSSTRVIPILGRGTLTGLTVTYTAIDGRTSVFSDCALAEERPDSDGDGIPDLVENAAPRPAGTNPEVATFVADNDRWVSVVAPQGAAVRDLSIVDDPDPQGHQGTDLPFGVFDFSIDGIAAGSSAKVSIVLPADAPVSSWKKYGPTTPTTPPRWWDFSMDLFTGTGATVGTADVAGYGISKLVSLNLVDGGRGDEDFLANGTIRDPGALYQTDDPPPTVPPPDDADPAPVAAAPPAPSAPVASTSGKLPATGADALDLLSVALALLALGGGLVATSAGPRRRRRAALSGWRAGEGSWQGRPSSRHRRRFELDQHTRHGQPADLQE